MALISPNYRLTMTELGALFPIVRYPQLGFTDFIGEFQGAGAPYVDAASAQTGKMDVAAGAGDVEFNSIIGCCYPRRLFVPHDNDIANANYTQLKRGCTPGGVNPTVEWTILDTNAISLFTRPFNPIGFCALQALMDVNFSASTDYFNAFTPIGTKEGTAYLGAQAPLPTGCQGFTATLMQWCKNPVDTGTNDPSNVVVSRIRWRTTDDAGTYRWFSMRIDQSGRLAIAYADASSPDNATWTVIADVRMGGGRERQSPGNRLSVGVQENYDATLGSLIMDDGARRNPLVFEVLIMGGQMMLFLDGNDMPWVWPSFASSGGNTMGYADQVEIQSNCFCVLEWSVHPTKFLAAAQIAGVPVNLGFVPTAGQIAQTELVLHTAPATPLAPLGWTPAGGSAPTLAIDAVRTVGTELAYNMTWALAPAGSWKGQSYVSSVAAVRAVTGLLPGMAYVSAGFPQDYEPEAIDVTHHFNFESLSIASQASLRFNNFNGQFSSASGISWVDNNGHVGVTIDMGISQQGTVATGPFRQFTGIANTAFRDEMGAGGQSHVVVECRDCWITADVPVWNLPWMDGWNIYYAIYYLAQQAGVTPDRMGFWLDGYVPTDPYGVGSSDTNPYFLPLGPAGTPLTRFTGGQNIHDVMSKLANSIGYMLFFDVYAVLQFKKFSFYNYPGAPYPISGKTFTAYASDIFSNPIVNQQCTDIMEGSYSGGLTEVRNAVTTIGVNTVGPYWDAVVGHAVDTSSWYNGATNVGGINNFKGFIDPLVWADNIFADRAYAQFAASQLLAFLRLPRREVHLSTWIQPDAPVYPLDVIFVSNPRSGASTWPFLVLTTSYHIAKGEAPRMELVGRWLPTQ